MDGSRFDALTRAVAGAHSRRALVLGALSGVATGLLGGRTASAAKRAPGEICRKNGDCASGDCLPKDARGRNRCGCVTEADCPNPRDACQVATCAAGVCGAVEVGGIDATCTPPTFWDGTDVGNGDPIGSPGIGCCAGLVCQGYAPFGPGLCGVNRGPVAVNGDVRHPWKYSCIPITITAYDADNDALLIQPITFPQNGILTDFVAFSGDSTFGRINYSGSDMGESEVPDLGAMPGLRAMPALPEAPVKMRSADSDFRCLDGGIPPQHNDGRNIAENGPVSWNRGRAVSCAEGLYLSRTLCYVPFSTTFTGTDSFTFTAMDVFGAVSAPALFTITVFEV